MYVTRNLSTLLKNPETLSEPPPPGPWSGIAVIVDNDMIEVDTGCCGSFKSIHINSLPIPQNAFTFFQEYVGGEDAYEYHRVLMIPAINKPLSSDTYYVVLTMGKYTGQVNTVSSEEDSETRYLCCSCKPYKYRFQPKPFDPNKCQQTKLVKSDEGNRNFTADIPRTHLWEETSVIPTSWSHKLNESEGQGLCENLRNKLPEFGFSIDTKSSDHVVVGRWYVPFIFVKEFGMSYKEQMKSSVYYKMSLEQRWERVFEAENVNGDMSFVEVDVNVKTEVVVLGSGVAVKGRGRHVDGVVRFESAHRGFQGLGLFEGVVERMKWEQARVGWTDVDGADVVLKRVEEHAELDGGREWRRFGCYVLVERFVLKRMNGSLALSYDFYHVHQLRTKWE